ncbi:tetratricopeptide repeat protein [Anaeramoeba ignava]|uniref:ER membrane protein complex subunit 2 n=1 Tax=Anaeramoeba ignava TaxID=1746090 RepID=A0A9Q0R9H5_ANAIG|nr:tetratricopeptide repeat protein [Anaeramoeba ignava]
MEKLIQKLNSQKDFNYKKVLHFLRKARKSKLRYSELIIKYGFPLIKNYSKKIDKEEYFEVLEQVYLAGLDCNKDASIFCIQILKEKFSTSLRFKILYGMFLESKGSFEKAKNLYGKILEKDSTNVLPQKRLVTIFKAQNDIPNAIKKLNQYLEVYMLDIEAWEELCELYLQTESYSKARFCLEELILLNPNESKYYDKCARVLYTIGGFDGLILARQYFSHSIKISKIVNPIDSYLGLLMTTNKIESLKKKTNQKFLELNNNLSKFAKEKLIETYQKQQENETQKENESIKTILDLIKDEKK